MDRPVLPGDLTCRFGADARIGVLLVQQETNSFAIRRSSLRDFTIHVGHDAERRLAGANSEFAGACAEVRDRGGDVVPLLYAHALPSGPLADADFDELGAMVSSVLRESGRLDGVVVSLHGALATVAGRGDAELLALVRDATGDRTPIALSLDLHANVTERLLRDVDVVTGYRSNPHIDQAETGQRAAALLCALAAGAVRPTIGVSSCPAIFPDESLRIPDGVLGRLLDKLVVDNAPAIVDVSVFPTQPWLDADGIGFTTVVVADGDATAASGVAAAITDAVWARRHEFVVERLLGPADAIVAAAASPVRPFVITESADAPTAGAAGDNPSMLTAFVQGDVDVSAMITIVDSPAVARCHDAGVGAQLELTLGASIDDRWSPPARLEGEVERLGAGEYRLTGVGYRGLTATLGRFAVVCRGRLRVLVTELPAWSADPGTWLHAGLDPYAVDLLVVRSCTDYLANFPHAASTAIVADTPGCATPRLAGLAFARCGRPVFPIDPLAER